jgi:hypothetical protein
MMMILLLLLLALEKPVILSVTWAQIVCIILMQHRQQSEKFHKNQRQITQISVHR